MTGGTEIVVGDAARVASAAKTSGDAFWRRFGRRGGIVLPWLAGGMAIWAMVVSALHLVPPYLVINEGGAPGGGTGPTVGVVGGGTPGQGTGPTMGVAEGTGTPGQGTRPTVGVAGGGTPGEGAGPTSSFFNPLGLARRFLVQPKERADFEWLAGRPMWSGVKLRVLLEHVELAVYNRELVNWSVDEEHFREYVLNPVINETNAPPLPGPLPHSEWRRGSELGQSESLDWRRALWEELYPRIRHENSVAEAVPIVVRHLHERVSVVSGPGLPELVPGIWRAQVTDERGFARLTVAGLRSVGVPARLDGSGRAEFWDGSKWNGAE